MKRRIIVGAVAVLVVGVIGVGISVAVNVNNGNYGQAATLFGADLKANHAILAETARLQKLSGVAEVAHSFSPLHLPNPSATFTVTMTPSGRLADVLRVSQSVSSAWSREQMADDLLTLTVDAGQLSVTKTKFAAPISVLREQLGVWYALRSHTRVAIAGHISDTPVEGAQALTITTKSGTSADAQALAVSYAAAFASPMGLGAGPSWNVPGMTGTGSLPPTPVLSLFSNSASYLPIEEQHRQKFSSGMSMTWDGGVHPDAHLWIAYLSGSHGFDSPSSHMPEASALAQAVLRSGIVGLNFGYEASKHGKIVQYGFYTGICNGRSSPSTTEAENLGELGITVAELHGGQPGLCLPPA